jgi:hypothetical protein
MRRIVLATAVTALVAAGPARALDAAGVDIIGPRLGMQEAEVVARLKQQGYALTRTREAITANTMDGRMMVALSPERGVTQISYVFLGRGAGEPEDIRTAVLTRFGDPDQAKPLTWCRAVGRDGICPHNQAALTFSPESLTLVLRTGTAGRS